MAAAPLAGERAGCLTRVHVDCMVASWMATRIAEVHACFRSRSDERFAHSLAQMVLPRPRVRVRDGRDEASVVRVSMGDSRSYS